MKSIKSCQFNMDNACVEIIYDNGSAVSLYTPMIEESLHTTVQSRSKLDWLIDSDPLEYAQMVLDGTLQKYLDIFDGYYREQKDKVSDNLVHEALMYD